MNTSAEDCSPWQVPTRVVLLLYAMQICRNQRVPDVRFLLNSILRTMGGHLDVSDILVSRYASTINEVRTVKALMFGR
jgi:hypothetical protein